MRVFASAVLGVLLVTVLSCIPASVHAYDWTVTGTHPRVILTPARIDSCKARILRSAYTTWWNVCKNQTQNSVTFGNKSDAELVNAAFYYNIAPIGSTSPTLAATLAYIHMVLRFNLAARDGGKAYKFYGEGESIVPGCMNASAVALDWCYTDLETSMRDSLLVMLADVGLGSSQIPDVTIPTSPIVTCETGLNHYINGCSGSSQYMFYALTLLGEGGNIHAGSLVQGGDIDSAACETLAQSVFDAERCRFYEKWMPSYLELSRYGSVDGYIGSHFWSAFGMAEALNTACGEAYADTASFLQNSNEYYLHHLEADGWWQRNVAKDTYKYQPRMAQSAIFSSYLTDPMYSPKWASLVDLFKTKYNTQFPTGEPRVWEGGDGWMPILYYDDSVTGSASVDSLSYYDYSWGSTGVESGKLVSARSGWDIGSTSTDVVTYFSVLPQIATGYRAGAFIITRGADRLLTDSGAYNKKWNDPYPEFTSEFDDHYQPYFGSCIANNTLTVDSGRANEWPGYVPADSAYTVNQGSCQGCGGLPWGGIISIPVDGECYYPSADSAAYYWPSGEFAGNCSPPPGGVCRGYGGRIVHFEDEQVSGGSSTYVYACADLSSQYRFGVDALTRQYVYVRPGFFIIRDLAWRTTEAYQSNTVRQHFHMIERPDMTYDTCNVIREYGASWLDDLGGVYRCPGVRTFTITRGSSEARMFILSPAVSSGTVRVIGGPNIGGDAWQQVWHDTDHTYTYNADPDSSSYEFWLEEPAGVGKNYIPGCSRILPNQTQIDNRNEQASSYSADWRIDVHSPTGTALVEMVTVFVVGASGMASVTATYESDVVRIVQDGGLDVSVTFGNEAPTLISVVEN